MARGVLTLYEVPAEVRAKGAAQARQQLHTLLSNPHLTEAQREDLRARLAWVTKWETANVGDLLPPPSSPPEDSFTTEPSQEVPSPTPTHHQVEVLETLQVDEVPSPTPTHHQVEVLETLQVDEA